MWVPSYEGTTQLLGHRFPRAAISLPDELNRGRPTMADDSLADLLDAFPPVDFAFAYGSAVVPQAGYTAAQRAAAMVDLVFAVDAPAAWHDANLAVHGAHYSAAGWVGGGAGAAALQERWGAGIYYNPLVRVRGRLLKYGVIRAATLRDDLRHWSTLYVSGRMHKPVRVLRPCEATRAAAAANHRAALAAALLQLPARFSEGELYRAVCGLSYAGDVRMGVAESPHKVRDIVAAQLPALRELYAAPISAAPPAAALFAAPAADGGDGADGAGGDGGTLEQSAGADARAALARALPSTARAELVAALSPAASRWRGAPEAADADAADDAVRALWARTADDAAANAQLAAAVRRSCARIVRRASAGQSLKGLITAGGARAAAYVGAKLLRRAAG